MKYVSIFLAGMLLVSCQPSSVSESIETFSYDLIFPWLIPWQSLFACESSDYYALVFSKGCQHCRAIETTVVAYALSSREPLLYFIEATSEIPKGDAIETTYGATHIESVFIVGWPTLLEIENHTLITQVVGEEAILKKLG